MEVLDGHGSEEVEEVEGRQRRCGEVVLDGGTAELGALTETQAAERQIWDRKRTHCRPATAVTHH